MSSRHLLSELTALLGADAVLSDIRADRSKWREGEALESSKPLCIALPSSTEQVAAVVHLCNEAAVAAASPSAQPSPPSGGVQIDLRRMNRILSLDVRNRRVTAQTGLTTKALNEAIAGDGLQYLPVAKTTGESTLGASLASDTSSLVLGVTVVLPNGSAARCGGATEDAGGYDLVGLFCGAGGALGVVTEATVLLSTVAEELPTSTPFHVIDSADFGDNTALASSSRIAGGSYPMTEADPSEALTVLRAIRAAFGGK